MWKKVKWALALAGVPAVLVLWACLNEPSVPVLSGPSELAVSLEMRAIPDQLTADGWSSSVIEVTWRDENGQRTSGMTINFDLGPRGSVGPYGGLFSDLGNLSPIDAVRPGTQGTEATAVSAVTDSNGIARVRYWAPWRTDQPDDTVVTITSRPAGTDFRSAFYRQVDIFLRAADRPSPGPAPPDPGSCPTPSAAGSLSLHCDSGEILAGTPMLVDAIGSDAGSGETIVSYRWDWGDGTIETTTTPTNSHTYNVALAGRGLALLITVTNSCGNQDTVLLENTIVAACPP